MIKVLIDGIRFYSVDQFVFNDGSVQVDIKNLPEMADTILIDASLKSPEDQMALLLVNNVLHSKYPLAPIHLFLPFCPYGRQDDPFVDGQANAMKAWGDYINSMKFTTVTVVDPHSNAVQHIDNLLVIDQVSVLRTSASIDMDLSLLLSEDITLVSPDAGANKKAHKICKEFGIDDLVRADKARDLATGQILETIIYGDVEGKTCLIVDDICDGGMTFIKLGEKLKEKGAKKVVLFVTHGIFSKGLSVFNGNIDEIYTTETWCELTDTSDYNGKFTITKA